MLFSFIKYCFSFTVDSFCVLVVNFMTILRTWWKLWIHSPGKKPIFTQRKEVAYNFTEFLRLQNSFLEPRVPVGATDDEAQPNSVIQCYCDSQGFRNPYALLSGSLSLFHILLYCLWQNPSVFSAYVFSICSSPMLLKFTWIRHCLHICAKQLLSVFHSFMLLDPMVIPQSAYGNHLQHLGVITTPSLK